MTVMHRSSSPDVLPERPHLSRRLFWLFFAACAGMLFFLSVFIAFRYVHARTGIAAVVARIVPYPAALEDGHVIWYVDVVRLSQVFDTNPVEGVDAFDASIVLLTRRAVVDSFAQQRDLSVSRADREAFLSEHPADLPVASWNQKTYEKYVLDPLLLSQKVEAALKDDQESQNIARIKLQKIQMDLQSGMDFEGIARYRSEDPAASFGGDLGLLDREHLPAGLESVFDLPVGEVSDILEQQDFFSLVKVYGEEVDATGVRQKVGLKIVSVHKASLSQIVDAYLADHPVRYFVH